MKIFDIPLLEVDGVVTEELEAFGRKSWTALYLNGERPGILTSHDGQEVLFWADKFDHAFFTTSSRVRQFAKDALSVERLRRMPWIGPLLRGEVDDMECFEVPSPEGRLRPPNRLYISWDGLYGCFLEPRQKGGWKFVTAYTASADYWRQRCRQGRRVPKKIAP